MAQQGRSPEVDAELKKLQGVQNGQRSCIVWYGCSWLIKSGRIRLNTAVHTYQCYPP